MVVHLNGAAELIMMMKGSSGGCHHQHQHKKTMMILRLGATKTLVCLILLLSGTWQIDATYEGGGGSIAEQEEETLHPIGDDLIVDAGSPSSSSSSSSSSEAIVNRLSSLTDGRGPGDQEVSASSVGRRPPLQLLLNSPTDRLSFCNESTVSHLTSVHFQIIENGLREYRCWTPRLGRLMSTLRQEMSRGSGGPSGGGRRQQQSANEGSRLRCRILFKYDTCRSNFAKYRSMDSPEISVEWPDEILNVINNSNTL